MLKPTLHRFVFSDLYGDAVQPEKVAALGDYLPSERNRRVLLAASSQKDGKQLGTGKRLGTLR